MGKLADKYRAFREWQKKPFTVAPLSDETHVCSTCGTNYQGNYCPRCGQSASIGRYSIRKATLLFLDVWGLGNRSMFRTIRDLLLRPGYMIRDYLQGMQMAYFPPFKMFFLIIALSLLVDTGLNIKGENHIKMSMENFEKGFDAARVDDEALSKAAGTTETALPKSAQEAENAKKAEEISKQFNENMTEMVNKTVTKVYEHINIVMLLWLIVLSFPLYLMFRHCPSFPDLRFSELLVAMVYTTNLMNIFSTVLSFFCINMYVTEFFSYLLCIAPIKQLTGYSLWSTVWRLLVSLILLMIAGFVIMMLVAVVTGIVLTAVG